MKETHTHRGRKLEGAAVTPVIFDLVFNRKMTTNIERRLCLSQLGNEFLKIWFSRQIMQTSQRPLTHLIPRTLSFSFSYVWSKQDRTVQLSYVVKRLKEINECNGILELIRSNYKSCTVLNFLNITTSKLVEQLLAKHFGLNGYMYFVTGIYRVVMKNLQ